MKKVRTQGITYIEPLEGSDEWYWGMNYASGDLYEAEELFKQGYAVQQNKLIFVHYPEGRLVRPVLAKKGQYFEKPIYCDRQIVILLVDFLAEEINLITFDAETEQVSPLVTLPLSMIEDCYNLMLRKSPLTLVRQPSDDHFQILWPERVDFHIGNTEGLVFREDDKLYFGAWYEDPDYREEVIVRDAHTGQIIERLPGSIMLMPDGQKWVLG